MGQYPSPYESGPYAADQGPGGNPYAAEPAYGPGAAQGGPGAAPYAPGGSPYMPVMPMPAPIFIVPPLSPEEVAEKGRRTTRGLGLGAVITGTVSVAIQVLAVLGVVLVLATSDSWTDGTTVAATLIAFISVLIVPALVCLAWATSFGLSLAACVRASGGGAGRQPAQWSGAGGMMGGLLGASVLQGVPAVMLLFVPGFYDDSVSSGNAMLIAAAIAGLGLLFAHIALTVKIRALGVTIEQQVPYAQAPYA
ncbi:hypothetical protein OHJ16_03330 [Actinomyces israelii]|uniref:Uncharacterized protein n=1 Tax=Actinomyces israelii TaxID=1659 RepID=A0ABT4I5S4_9ACTO|nr:hypothetical protein [Actinomyces israelii]MCZ0857080.1 hypothetical protein [Actinomyces israelii]